MAVVGIAREKMGSPGQLRETRDGFAITRTFIVRTNSHADGPIVVDRAVGLPQRGNVYASLNESHPYLFCVSRTIRRAGERSLVWIVECEYETPKPGEKEEQQQDNERPEFELPVIKMGSSSELRDVVKDRDDNPIVNSAGDPFRPHPKKEVFFPTLMIQRNEPVTSPIMATKIAYEGKVNSDSWWGLDKGQWRCARIEADLQSRPVGTQGLQVAYLSVAYEFHARETWDLEVLDAGYNKIVGGSRQAFLTKDGREYEGLLDGSTGAESASANFLTFPIYGEVAFGALQLPQSFLDAVPR